MIKKDLQTRTPRFIFAIIIVLALMQPVQRFTLLWLYPENTMPTGLGILDSALFFQSMDMFFNGFESLYACTPGGIDAGIQYYAVPHLWLYGVLGIFSHMLHLTPLIADGFACGLSAAFFLFMIYRLFRAAIPRHADTAFLLFALSGGPGGLLYLLTGLTGLHDHPAFATYFFRFAVYDLMEGPHLNPALYFPRFYYTLSLALCTGALAALLHALDKDRIRPLLFWMLPLALGSFINARYSVFTLALALLLLYTRDEKPLSFRSKSFAALLLPVIAGNIPAWLLMQTNRTVIQNHLEAASMAMWLSPFLAVACIHLLIAAPTAIRAAAAMPLKYSVPVFALIGYLAAFCAGYVLYQGYWGNLLTGRDGSVAATVSDPALIGVIIGMAAGWILPRFIKSGASDESGVMPPWILLWFLAFFAIGISGWGRGWFLRFGPQRMQVLIWPPLCILTAIALSRMGPALSRSLTALICTLGLISILTATFGFQGPRAINGPFSEYQAQVMSSADADLLAALPEKDLLLAPPPASDIAALRKRIPVVYGVASFNLTTVPYIELKSAVEAFFHPDIPEKDRHAFIEKYAVQWIWCPDSRPVAEKTLTGLREAAWLKERAAAGKGAVFQVLR